MTLWTPSVTIAGSPLDDRVLDLVTIRYGRQNSRQTVNGTTCTIGLVWKSDSVLYDPDLLRLGARVVVTVETLDGPFPATVTRFDGAISDVTLGKNTAQIIATSNVLARLGRTVIDAPPLTGPLPDVFDTLFQSIEVQHPDLDIAFTGTATSPQDVTVDVPARTNVRALDALLDLAANDPAAFLYENVAGTGLNLSTGTTRLPDQIVATLLVPQNAILDRVRLERTVNGRINEATVEWTGGEETATGTTSLLRFGPYGRRLDTRIDNADDAQAVAFRLISGGASDSWNLESVPVELSEVADSFSIDAWLSLLRINRLLLLPNLGDGLPDLPTLVWLEGWDETLSRSRWTLDLHITDPRSVGWPQRWFEVPPAIRWTDLTGPTWAQTIGSWADVPEWQTWTNYALSWDDLLTEWITA